MGNISKRGKIKLTFIIKKTKIVKINIFNLVFITSYMQKLVIFKSNTYNGLMYRLRILFVWVRQYIGKNTCCSFEFRHLYMDITYKNKYIWRKSGKCGTIEKMWAKKAYNCKKMGVQVARMCRWNTKLQKT